MGHVIFWIQSRSRSWIQVVETTSLLTGVRFEYQTLTRLRKDGSLVHWAAYLLTKDLQIGVNGNWLPKKKLYSIRCTCSPCSFSCEHQNQEALQLLLSCWLSHWLGTLMWTLSPSWIPGINIIWPNMNKIQCSTNSMVDLILEFILYGDKFWHKQLQMLKT